MKNKQRLRLCFALLTMICSHCAAQLPMTVPKNEYGLIVFTKGEEYLASVKTDSSKKMVNLNKYLQPFITDWKYATKNNFTKQVLYKNPAAYMRLEAAKALGNVQKELKKKGLGLKIFDAYRPYTITKKMWEIVPDERYAANPAKGSGHNRGAAVDLTLINLKTGKELSMPTHYDDFTEKAHHSYMQLDSAILKNRQLLKDVMIKYGFVPLETEWWHYYLPNAAERFEILDIDFNVMRKITKDHK